MSNMKQPSEPGWYVTADGNDLLSYDGDAWHMHNISAEALLFADGTWIRRIGTSCYAHSTMMHSHSATSICNKCYGRYDASTTS